MLKRFLDILDIDKENMDMLTMKIKIHVYTITNLNSLHNCFSDPQYNIIY